MTELETHVRAHVDAAITALNRLDHGDIPDAKKWLESAIVEILAVRDSLIVARRAGEQVDTRLGDMNAVLSTIFGTEYPLAGLQWKRVTEAKGALLKLLQQAPAR